MRKTAEAHASAVFCHLVILLRSRIMGRDLVHRAMPVLFQMRGDRVHQDDLDLDRARRRVGDDGAEGFVIACIKVMDVHIDCPFQQGLALVIAQYGADFRDRTGAAVIILQITLDDQQRHTVLDLVADTEFPDRNAIGVHRGAKRRIGRRSSRESGDHINAENPRAGQDQGHGNSQPAPGTTGHGSGHGLPLFRLTFPISLMGLFRFFHDFRCLFLELRRLEIGKLLRVFDLGRPDITARGATHTTTVRANRLWISAIARGTRRTAEYYAHLSRYYFRPTRQ